MSQKRPRGEGEAAAQKRSVAEEDARREAAILRDVIDLHPTHLTGEELVRRGGS
jgi:hypothetical protein